VADTVVANASPLIFLSRAGHLPLLHHFAGRVLVPRPVADEIRLKGGEDVTARAISETSWMEVVPAPTIPEEISQWGLGPGEAAVLAIAAANPGMEAVIDDLAGRKCAAHLGIPVRGTLGIVLAAKRRGLIPQAQVVIEDMLRSGLYLSRPVLHEALRRVDEEPR